MRTLALILGAVVATSAFAQKVPVVDLLQLKLGTSFPIPPLMETKATEGSLPSYTITVPMPESSPLRAFSEYDVDVMYDTKQIYLLRAKRTFDSNDSCTRALKSLIAPVSNAFQVKATKSDLSLFLAGADDVEVEASCAFREGSPYPTLSLLIGSKAGKERHYQQMRKRFAR